MKSWGRTWWISGASTEYKEHKASYKIPCVGLSGLMRVRTADPNSRPCAVTRPLRWIFIQRHSMSLSMHTIMYVYIYVYIHIYIYIHTYIDIDIYIYIVNSDFICDLFRHSPPLTSPHRVNSWQVEDEHESLEEMIEERVYEEVVLTPKLDWLEFGGLQRFALSENKVNPKIITSWDDDKDG